MKCLKGSYLNETFKDSVVSYRRCSDGLNITQVINPNETITIWFFEGSLKTAFEDQIVFDVGTFPQTTVTPSESSIHPESETVTPTPTQTLTPNFTLSPTKTPTLTPTITKTQTTTPSNQPTRTNTPTNTQTPTVTKTENSTPEPTPTRTKTPTPSVTRTKTPTPSVTRTLTPTRTPTRTKTPTPTITSGGCQYALTVCYNWTIPVGVGATNYSYFNCITEQNSVIDNSVQRIVCSTGRPQAQGPGPIAVQGSQCDTVCLPPISSTPTVTPTLTPTMTPTVTQTLQPCQYSYIYCFNWTIPVIGDPTIYEYFNCITQTYVSVLSNIERVVCSSSRPLRRDGTSSAFSGSSCLTLCIPPTPSPTSTMTVTPTRTCTPSVTTSPPPPVIISTIVNVSGCVGDIVEVPININMNPSVSIGSLSYAINYNSSNLSGDTLNKISQLNPLFNGVITNFGNFPSIGYQFRAAWFDQNAVSFNGVIFKVRFKILTPGTHELSWDTINFGNCEYTDGEAVTIEPISWINGSVQQDPNCNSFIEIVPSVSVTQTPTVTPTKTTNNTSQNTIFLTFS